MTTRRAARRRAAELGAGTSAGRVASRPGPLAALGHLTAQGLAYLGVGPAEHHDPGLDTARGAAVALGSLTALVSPVVGVVIAVAGWHLPRRSALRRSQAQRRALGDEVFLAVQLCALSVHTGATVPQTVAAVAPHLHGRLGGAFATALQRHRAGGLFDTELGRVVTELGDPVTDLVGILRAAHSDGDPVEPALVRLGDRLRDERRRATETRVRALSVRLLVPLVCCSLPGFVLITVVPLAVDALGGLAR